MGFCRTMDCEFINEILDICYMWNAFTCQHSKYCSNLSYNLYGFLFILYSFISSTEIFFDKDIKSKYYLKISFGFWRRTAATFQLVIIIYSMIILIGLYIFQVIFFSLSNFKNTPCFLCFSLKQSLNF